LLLTAMVMRFPSEDAVLPEPKAKNSGKADDDFEAKDYTTKEMLTRSSFWRFFLFAIAISSAGSVVISFAKDLAVSVGASVALATTLVGVLSISNGLGRIFCGYIFDHLGRRKTMLIANGLAILASLVMMMAILFHSIAICVVGLCVTGVAYGCAPTISAAFVGTFYGTKYFAMNFSIANTSLIPASFTATIASALVASTGSYLAPFIMLTAFACIGLVLNLSIRTP